MKRKALFALCMALCSILSASCTVDENFVPYEYSHDISVVNMIAIDVRDRRIDVVPSADSQIRFSGFESSKESYSAELEGGKLTIKGVTNKDWTDYIGTKPSISNRMITLEVPNALLGSLEIATTNEKIDVQGLSVNDDVTLSSNGGDVVFTGLSAGSSINLNAKNGNIKGFIAGSYEEYSISVEIKKGDTNIESKESGDKSLQLNANNGDIAIEFLGRCYFLSHN